MESHICTHCGYEGKPVRPPSDHAGEDEPFAVTVVNKLIFVATFMPIKVGWIVRLAQRGKAKHCPNCGLPLMVKLSSDAGFVAKRRHDLKAGIRWDQPEKPVVAFGKDIVLPSDEEPPALVIVPTPQNLPHVQETLKETPEEAPAPTPAPAEAAEPPRAKKPVDPDQW